MAVPVIMPKQGQSVESCIISEIRKKKGDRVLKGDILFVYETDKATFEEEAKVDGVVLEIFYTEGDEVPVFSNVFIIGSEGENIDEFLPGKADLNPIPMSVEVKTVSEDSLVQERSHETTGSTQVTHTASSSAISPRARKLAAGKGADTSILKGSGPHNRIIERDVQAATDAERLTPLARKIMKENPLLTVSSSGTGLAGAVTGKDLQVKGITGEHDYEIKPLTNISRRIARAMYESLQNSAQLTHHLGADARRINEPRKRVKKAVEAGSSSDITLNDMICFATVRALKKFPNANSHFLGDRIKNFFRVHLGVAVDTDRGLMVPVVRNADELKIEELSAKIREIVTACRKGSIDPEILSSEAASFTVSNLGNYGVEMFTPVINLPQVGILGVNTIVLRPKDLGDGTIGFVPYLGLSLTYDHRAIDGGEATRFVKQVAMEIENLDFEV